jgi:SAM-dependent methyltransferase
LGPDPLEATPVTDLLFGRLSSESVAAIDARLAPAQRGLVARASPADRSRLLLSLAAHHRVAPALAQTGISAEMPPPGVHAMSHEDVAAGGSAYYADLVADALGNTALGLEAGQVVLDFGCSSGRVVRVLAAAYPDIEWHGCDPNDDAVSWASDHLAGIHFQHGPEHPPLGGEGGRFDVVYAISIWSHFSERAALAWIGEMARIVRPGGRLVLTAQGSQTIAEQAAAGSRPASQVFEILRALYRHGFWFAAEFGAGGDHGVRNPDWGTAFFTSEWLLTYLTPRWRLLGFWPGRAEGSQDLYVLEPR